MRTTRPVTRSTSARIVTATAIGALALAGVMPAGHAASAAAPAKSKDATYATAASGYIPKGLPYDLGHGHMKNGRLKVSKDAPSYSHVNIKNIDGAWKKTSVRLVDVAGDRKKEAVVIISASAGGVAWPNYVAVYSGSGKLLNWWDSGQAIQKGRKGPASGAREGVTFTNMTNKSVDVRVNRISTGSQSESNGTGRDTFRLSKNSKGQPVWKLITRRDK